MTTTLRRTLEELHLLKCSLLPGELLVFTEDAARWNSLLDSYALDPDCVDLPEVGRPEALAAPHFQVKLEGSSNVFFDVALLYDHSDGGGDANLNLNVRPGPPRVAARGDSLGRDEQERWQRVVSDALREVQAQDSEYPLYELISTHLLPQLHASTAAIASSPSSSSSAAPASSEATGRARASQPEGPAARYHALFVSHHLKSPQKRRALAQWTHELALSGFAKVGHPGVIYCEGAQEDVAEFVDRVKGMQWLALRLRFIEPTPPGSTSSADGDKSEQGRKREWAEFEKVGEVVEEMRRLDREKFIVEMGIGSAGNPPAVK